MSSSWNIGGLYLNCGFILDRFVLNLRATPLFRRKSEKKLTPSFTILCVCVHCTQLKSKETKTSKIYWGKAINLNHSSALCTNSALSTHLEVQWQWDRLTVGPLLCGVAERSRTVYSRRCRWYLKSQHSSTKKTKFRCVISLCNTKKKNSNVISN